MQAEREAGHAVDVLRHVDEAGASVQSTDCGPGMQTDASIAQATLEGDQALLAGKPLSSHPR